jgi:hypothetical protein
MKKIVLVLNSGEEIVLGHATSLFKYLLRIESRVIVPIHGNRDYSIVKNVYNKMCDQYVTYKAIANE